MCDYLDSTSLGWLVNEHKRLTEADREFRVVVRPDQYDGLFGPTKLQQVLPVDDAPLPEVAGWKPMEVGQCSTIEITEHALDCHRPLADMPGPSQQAFQRIVRRLADEMEGD